MRELINKAIFSELFRDYSLKTDSISLGNVSSDMLFDIASMTKGYLHLCFLILEEQGEIQLTDKVQKYIPELSGLYSKEVELIHLITNTVSFDMPNWRDINIKDLYSVIISSGFTDFPGKSHVYTNMQAFLLGIILEKITGLILENAISSILPKKYFSGLTFNPYGRTLVSSPEIQNGTTHDPLTRRYQNTLKKNIGVSGMFASANTVFKTGQFFLETESGRNIFKRIKKGFAYSNGKAGIGFYIWEKEYSGYDNFDKNTIFNFGFTGCIQYINLKMEKNIVLMTNKTFYPDNDNTKANHMYNFRKKLIQSLIKF